MKGNTKYRRSIVAVVGIVFGLMMLGNMALADSDADSDDEPDFFAPHSEPFHKKFRKWSAEWWQFVLSIPASENPLLDTTGERCVVGQRGPVWFLFGGTATRTCSIPEGKALFFPVLNLADINVTTQTAEELRAEIAPCLDLGAVTTLSVEVDGEPIEKLQKKPEKFRVRSVVFDITVPADGFLDPGTYSPVVDDGFYVMLKPLDVGEHTLHIIGATQGCPISGGPFAVDVTYNLTIVPVTLD